MQITALETSTHIYKLIWINICEAEQWGGETEKKERLRRQTSVIVSIRAPIPTPDDTTKKKKGKRIKLIEFVPSQ